jgi:hypothetical protein
MSVGSNGKALGAIARQLGQQWEHARGPWRDEKSEEFERTYLSELMSRVDRAASVFDELNRLVEQVRSECE